MFDLWEIVDAELCLDFYKLKVRDKMIAFGFDEKCRRSVSPEAVLREDDDW